MKQDVGKLLKYLTDLSSTSEKRNRWPVLNTDEIKRILSTVKNERRSILLETESKQILSKIGIPVPLERIVHSRDEAEVAAKEIGFPLVMKIVSPDVTHKSESGGVETDLRDFQDVRKAFSRILERVSDKAPQAKLKGMSIQCQAMGVEVMVGAKRDQAFGPFIMFGIGGILVELLKDVTIRYAPISISESFEMIRGIKSFPILNGFRGKERVDIDFLSRVILSVSELINNFPEISEIDVNPLIVGKRGGIAADARIVLSEFKNDPMEDSGAQVPAVRTQAVGTILNPRSVAIVGASRDRAKIGGRLLWKIINHGFAGTVCPVNPKGEVFPGLVSYKSISEIEQQVDLAIIGVPAEAAITVMQECAQNKVKTAIVLSSGFAESGVSGTERQHRLLDAARKGGVRLVGPNTVGILHPISKLYANFSTFAETTDIAAGNVGFVTQSGALGAALVSRAFESGVKVSAWVSTGNEADIDWTDVVDFYISDPETKVIVAYVEGLRDGRKLRSIAKSALRSQKPVIVFKSGITSVGTKTARSHTGAIAVDNVLFDAFSDQFGLIRADELSDSFEIAKAFSLQPLPKGSKIGIISASGGANVIIADELTKRGINIPTLSEKTQAGLARDLPFTTIQNPVDVAGTVINNPGLFKETTATVLQDPNIDAVIIAVPGGSESLAEIHARGISECTIYGKPILVAWLYSPTEVQSAIQILNNHKIPVYFDVEKAAKAISAMVQYREFLSKSTS